MWQTKLDTRVRFAIKEILNCVALFGRHAGGVLTEAQFDAHAGSDDPRLRLWTYAMEQSLQELSDYTRRENLVLSRCPELRRHRPHADGLLVGAAGGHLLQRADADAVHTHLRPAALAAGHRVHSARCAAEPPNLQLVDSSRFDTGAAPKYYGTAIISLHHPVRCELPPLIDPT